MSSLDLNSSMYRVLLCYIRNNLNGSIIDRFMHLQHIHACQNELAFHATCTLFRKIRSILPIDLVRRSLSGTPFQHVPSRTIFTGLCGWHWWFVNATDRSVFCANENCSQRENNINNNEEAFVCLGRDIHLPSRANYGNSLSYKQWHAFVFLSLASWMRLVLDLLLSITSRAHSIARYNQGLWCRCESFPVIEFSYMIMW